MLTDEQREAVNCAEDLMLSACPGSGKTRVIVSKLSRTIEEVRNTSRSVACITYTNAAVHEIEARLRLNIQPGDERYFDICTIHSFCLNHIFRPFCHLVKGYKNGFKVLTPDNDVFEMYVGGTLQKFERYKVTFKDIDEFSQLRISADGEAVGNPIEKGGLTKEIAAEFWKRICADGYIDFASIIYYSLDLLRGHPQILSYVASKFAWILVDEFQDTTDLQVEILTLIAAQKRSRFLLVGDHLQSIFGFAGAQPNLAGAFAKKIGARTDIVLSGNFRSSKPILAHAELLFSRNPPMVALGVARKFKELPIYQNGSSPFQLVTDHFLPALAAFNIPVGNAAVLAPTWFSLFPLGRRLREFGISIVGPGARPYRRNRYFAPLAEQVCGYLMEPRADAIAGVERALFHTVLDVTGRAHFELFSYAGRTIVFKLLAVAKELFEKDEGAISWLEEAAEQFAQVLVKEGLFTNTEQNIFAMSVEEMKTDMRRNEVDLNNLGIDELGIYAKPHAALKLSSLHHAKGREFDAVAMIDLHEGKIPSYYARTPEEVEEAKRLFYVGVTRAKRLLYYFTDASGRRNGPTRFLQKCTGVGVC